MVSTPAPTTNHSHYIRARDVKAGQYFKYYGRWHLAIQDARAATGDYAGRYSWMIYAYTPDGFDEWKGIAKGRGYAPIGEELVEISNPGKRPGPFTPATLRRKARAHREEANRHGSLADRKTVLARRLENGTIKEDRSRR